MTPGQQEISNALSSVNIETDWRPDSDMLNRLFEITSNQVFAGLGSYQVYREDSEVYGFFMTKNPMIWFWNQTKNRRDFIERLISAYHAKSNNYGGKSGFRGMASEDQAAIATIVQRVYDALPLKSENPDLQRFRINLLRVPIGRSIDFTSELREAIFLSSLSLDKTITTFWVGEGKTRSKDPAFFGLCWNRIERSKGYVDARNEIISYAAAADHFPEVMINDLSTADHSSNKISICRQIAIKIDGNKNLITSDRFDSKQLNASRKAAIASHRNE